MYTGKGKKKKMKTRYIMIPPLVQCKTNSHLCFKKNYIQQLFFRFHAKPSICKYTFMHRLYRCFYKIFLYMRYRLHALSSKSNLIAGFSEAPFRMLEANHTLFLKIKERCIYWSVFVQVNHTLKIFLNYANKPCKKSLIHG